MGYSDHTIGPDAAVVAVALGARIIEKHFTLDNHLSDFRDHQLSADPDEMRETVKRIRETEKMLERRKEKSKFARRNALLLPEDRSSPIKIFRREVKSPGGPFMGSAKRRFGTRQRK